MQNTVGPVGGIAVEHPLQATVYAYRKGKMKLLVPFEITVVPIANGVEPERPAPSGYPISGAISNQQAVRPSQPVNGYGYRPHTGPGYPHSVSYQSYQPKPQAQPSYSAYYPINGYYNQAPYRGPGPYYAQSNRVVDTSRTKPFPQYRPPFQQVGK